MKANVALQSSILAVDDERDFLESLKDSLRDSFQHVFVAGGVSEALEILKENRIDCVVTDYAMPEIDGLQFIKILHVQYPSIPVILLTGGGNSPEVIEAIANSAFDFMGKPFLIEALKNRIANALLLPRFERLLIDLTRAQFPEISIDKIATCSHVERVKMLTAIEALIKSKIAKST